MNKKISLFLMPILLLGAGSLSSCNGDGKVNLVFGDQNATSYSTINFLDLKEKVNSRETFLLVVQYSDGCGCWVNEARPIVEKFVNEKHVIIYHIKYEELSGGGNDFGITIRTGEVSFAIFSKGEVARCITTSDGTALKQYSSFKTYMSETVNLPRFYYVSLSQLDSLKASSKKNVIYFSRKTCSDCSYLNRNYLQDFLNEHSNYSKNIYVLECDAKGIRLDDEGNLDSEQWQAFKHQYGLSTLNNPTYGYDTGYVPTLQIVSNNSYLSQIVYFNDSITKQDEKYYVSNSYFTEERLPNLEYLSGFRGTKVLKGLEVPSSDVIGYGDYHFWDNEKAAKYHDLLMEQFLLFAEKQ